MDQRGGAAIKEREEKNITAENAKDQRGKDFLETRLRLFLHPDLPEESLIVQCLYYACVDEMIRVGFFRLRVLA